MKHIGLVLLVVLVFISTVKAEKAEELGKQVAVRLVADSSQALPGGTVKLGAFFALKDGWHIYWKNPGDSGLPTKVDFSSDHPGVTFGDLQWPVPMTFVQPGNITGYGYEEEALLYRDVILSDTLQAGDVVSIEAKLSWLLCSNTLCVPGGQAQKYQLTLGGKLSSSEPKLFQSWSDRYPQELSNQGSPRILKVSHPSLVRGQSTIQIEVGWDSPASKLRWYGYVPPGLEMREPQFQQSGPQAKLSFDVTTVSEKKLQLSRTQPEVLFVEEGGASQQGYTVRLPVR